MDDLYDTVLANIQLIIGSAALTETSEDTQLVYEAYSYVSYLPPPSARIRRARPPQSINKAPPPPVLPVKFNLSAVTVKIQLPNGRDLIIKMCNRR